MTAEATLELAGRVEAATGPDRELDALIAHAVYGSTGHDVLSYTGSLDAAMTLVPEGWRVYAIQNQSFPPSEPQWFAGLDHIPHTGSMIGKSPFAALALCAAALRAIAGSPKGEG